MFEKVSDEPLLRPQDDCPSRKEKIDLPVKSVLVAYFFILNILTLACYSVIAPFMPIELEAKGIQQEYMGSIIGILGLPLILMPPLVGVVI